MLIKITKCKIKKWKMKKRKKEKRRRRRYGVLCVSDFWIRAQQWKILSDEIFQWKLSLLWMCALCCCCCWRLSPLDESFLRRSKSWCRTISYIYANKMATVLAQRRHISSFEMGLIGLDGAPIETFRSSKSIEKQSRREEEAKSYKIEQRRDAQNVWRVITLRWIAVVATATTNHVINRPLQLRIPTFYCNSKMPQNTQNDFASFAKASSVGVVRQRAQQQCHFQECTEHTRDDASLNECIK